MRRRRGRRLLHLVQPTEGIPVGFASTAALLEVASRAFPARQPIRLHSKPQHCPLQTGSRDEQPVPEMSATSGTTWSRSVQLLGAIPRELLYVKLFTHSTLMGGFARGSRGGALGPAFGGALARRILSLVLAEARTPWPRQNPDVRLRLPLAAPIVSSHARPTPCSCLLYTSPSPRD